MNTFALIFIAFAVAVNCLTEVEYQAAFDTYKIQFGKTYLPTEETHRYAAFKNNLDFVNNFDSKSRGFKVKINSFSDLSSQEFASMYNGLRITANPVVVPVVENVNLPDSVDWRNKGAVTDVKNQGQCGSCWSFSATGSIEGAYFLSNGQLVSLSEQNLVDCSTSQGNQGCQGGLMDQAFQYVISNSGIDTESSYPYTATGPNSCEFSTSNVGATISSFTDVTSGDENALQAAVAMTPVSVAIDASHQSFQMYSSGVYNEDDCSTSQLDHGVLTIGYGTDSGSPYWLVKNSWGTDWGLDGYIEMSRNNGNQCGIASSASYPVI